MKNLFLAAFISLSFFSNAQYIQETYNMSDSLVERKVEKEGKLSFEFNNRRDACVAGDTLYWVFYDGDENLLLKVELVIMERHRVGDYSLYLMKHTVDGYYQLFALKEKGRKKEAIIFWAELTDRCSGNVNY